MPKSKNRKNHSKKVAARRQKINGVTNLKKKQIQSWLQNLQLQQQQAAQNVQAVEADINQPQIVDVAEAAPEVPPVAGGSGQL